MSIHQICRSMLLPVIIDFVPVNSASALNTVAPIRAIPEDNLAYPVLITLKSGGKASGFFLNTQTAQYFVTANHVLVDDPTLTDPATHTYKPDAYIELLSYSRDPLDTKRNVTGLNLQQLQKDGHIRTNPSQDVVAITMGTMSATPSTTTRVPVSNVPGVTFKETATQGMLGASVDAVKTLDQVLIGNDVIMFGYPTSLGLKQLPQLDPDRPLLRKGIVAGKNMQRHSLILDCPVYFGDSGGPVFELDREALGTRFWLIGMVKEYVPFAESSRTFMIVNNSGYSVATPMDAVLELIRQ